jgi:hypothetical protein
MALIFDLKISSSDNNMFNIGCIKDTINIDELIKTNKVKEITICDN